MTWLRDKDNEIIGQRVPGKLELYSTAHERSTVIIRKQDGHMLVNCMWGQVTLTMQQAEYASRFLNEVDG